MNGPLGKIYYYSVSESRMTLKHHIHTHIFSTRGEWGGKGNKGQGKHLYISFWTEAECKKNPQ